MNLDGRAVTIRPAGPLDVAVIAAIHADCFAGAAAGEVWSEAAIAQILAMPQSFGLIAVAGPPGAPAPRAAGFLLARAVAEEAEVLSLGVPTAWRRRGSGTALLRAALRRCRQTGARRLYLEAAEDNAPARGLYLAEGFTEIGRRPGYYRRPGLAPVTALVFVRDVA